MRSATILSLMAVGASAALLPRQAASTTKESDLDAALKKANGTKPEDVSLASIITDAAIEQDAPKCSEDCKPFTQQFFGNCKGSTLADCKKELCNDNLMPNYVKCENCFTTNKYQTSNTTMNSLIADALELSVACVLIADYDPEAVTLGEFVDPQSGKKLKEDPEFQQWLVSIGGPNVTDTNSTAAANGTKANGNGTATDSATPAATTSGSGALKAMAPIGVALLSAAVAALL